MSKESLDGDRRLRSAASGGRLPEGESPRETKETKPTGHILWHGRQMAYWLPEGVTPADIGLST
jgi:hypothetical protein